MTDRVLPHATAIANDVVATLMRTGNAALAERVASLHRATCDLVHHLHAEREASTPQGLIEARRKTTLAVSRLRDGSH
jgi:hypothetical protein